MMSARARSKKSAGPAEHAAEGRSTNVFAPVAAALLLVLVAGIAAVMCTRRADGFLSSLNIETPALGEVSPLLTREPASDAPSERVILVVIDGLRLDQSFGRASLEALRRQGVDGIARSHYPSISRPNHATIVTGIPPLASGVRNNKYHGQVYLDSLMDRLHAVNRESSYVADHSSSLAYLFADDFDTVTYGRWPGGFEKIAVRTLKKRESALVVLLPGEVDDMGHKHGGISPEYDSAMKGIDEQLVRILGEVDFTRDTVIVTADHGHTDEGGHGGEEESVMEVPLILAGAGINRDALLGTVELADLAPTAAWLLGVPSPGHSTGRTLVEVLELSPEQKESILAGDKERIARNANLYLAAVEENADEHSRQVYIRVAVASVALLIACVALWFALRSGAILIDWKVLLIAIPAYPLCYYGLLQVLGQSLSFSTIQNEGEEMSKLFNYGLIATAAQILAGWFALYGRVVLRDRLSAANALIAFGLVFGCIPTAALWAFHGPPPHLEIPRSTVALLIPANYIAVATYAIGAATLLMVEIIVFFARAVDPRILSSEE